MSTKKTNHILMARDEQGIVVGINLQTNRFSWCDEDSHKTFHDLTIGGEHGYHGSPVEDEHTRVIVMLAIKRSTRIFR